MAEKPYASEVALCAAFIAVIPKDWTAYAETAGWDILLVRKDGFQIGVQAKLRIGVEVINQAIEESPWHCDLAGPDCRAILVPPKQGHGFERICAYIGLTIITMDVPLRLRGISGPQFWPALPTEAHGLRDIRNTTWHEWCPTKRHKLPEYVPDVAAGASAPLQLTQWKIAAIKIMITLQRRGYVTRADFAKHRLDHRRWLSRESQWLERKDGVWVKGKYSPGDYQNQHPTAWAKIEADAEKWMVPGGFSGTNPEVLGTQSSLFATVEKGQTEA